MTDDLRAMAEEWAETQARELSLVFRKAAEVAMPSVVTVRSKTKARLTKSSGNRSSKGANPFKGTPFEDYFNGEDMPNFHGFDGQQQPRQGMGSGVIIDKSGIVLTNNHVVSGADEVIVHLPDGREFKAEDIKTDEESDLAVLRIKGAGTLPAAKMGNSDELEIGDWVLAIGNPFELEQTVSQGIISGKGREIRSIRRSKFLQTDAAINPGNSGGPLVNLDGEVIGINTAIATNSGTFSGIGFAIPVNAAKWVVDQLLQRGSVQRAYLGVAIGPVTNELAGKFGVKANQGVLVSEVFPDSPAAKAGVQVGDVIVKFASTEVHNPRELQELVERAPLDSKQSLEVLRDGKHETVQMVAKALPKKFGLASSRSDRSDDSEDKGAAYESSDLGLSVSEITGDQAKEAGYEGFSGVVITEVDPSSVAAEQGLRKGMLIMKVGDKKVATVDDFKAAVKRESLKKGILLLVRTQAGNRFVVLQSS